MKQKCKALMPREMQEFARQNLIFLLLPTQIVALVRNGLELLVKPFAKTEIGLVAGEIQALPSTNWLEKYSDRKDTLSQKHTLAHSFCPYGQTANLAIRKQAFEQVGLFRPYLTTGGDADICWRILRETDWQLEFVEAAFIRHRHRATLQELRSQWQRYGRSNRYLHELHGVQLMPESTLKNTLYRLSRWVLKENPVKSC
jgi:GT2 family glycosyltransferase